MIGRILKALALGASLAIGASAQAANPLDGTTLRVVIAHKAGNTTDTIARLFAKTLAKYLPNTAINVQNLDGNGGTLAMQEIHEAKGSLVTIGFVNSSVVFSQATQGDELPYDVKQFHWLGALASSQRVLVVRKDALDRADPAKPHTDGKPLVSLTMSASAQNHVDGLLLNALTNLRLKMVPGFKTDQQNAMLLAGDADAGIGTYENFREFIEAGDLVPVLKFGSVGYPDALASLPTLDDVALPNAPGAVVAMSKDLSDMGRFVLAAPSTPDDQVAALAAAFDQVVADAEYLDGLKKANFIGTPANSAVVTAFITDLLGNEEAVKQLRAVVACGEKINDGALQVCDHGSF